MSETHYSLLILFACRVARVSFSLPFGCPRNFQVGNGPGLFRRSRSFQQSLSCFICKAIFHSLLFRLGSHQSGCGDLLARSLLFHHYWIVGTWHRLDPLQKCCSCLRGISKSLFQRVVLKVSHSGQFKSPKMLRRSAF